MLRLAFGRPWRQTEGMLGLIMDLLDLDLAVPDHTTFSRRSANLGVATALKKTSGPVHVVIDSTGLKGTVKLLGESRDLGELDSERVSGAMRIA